MPLPSPLEAPATSPAMSTMSIVAGITTFVPAMACSFCIRSSGTSTTPTLGSIVQNG